MKPDNPIYENKKPLPTVSLLVHEIKNPLCNIYLACDMLHLTELDETQRICLAIIMRGSVRINNLTEAILNFPETPEAFAGAAASGSDTP